MNRVDLVNGVAAAAAIVGSLATAAVGPPVAGAGPGERVEEDVSPYRRIASASTVADPLLRDLCPADRLVAVSDLTAAGPQGHRYAGLQRIGSLDAVETIIALSPDVLLVSNVGAGRKVARLREAGIEVIDLGPPTGWASLQEDIVQVGEVCGRPAAARRLVETLGARLERVAPNAASGPRALYVTVYGGRYYGGTTGSSYHDVLTFAGLQDAAATGQFDAFPQYTAEQLLTLDPAVLVTKPTMAGPLCRDEALQRLKACREGAVVEIEGAYLDDPGPGMLVAAERIRDAVAALKPSP